MPARVRRLVTALAALALAVGLAAPAAAGTGGGYPFPEPVRGPAATHDPSMIQLKDGTWETFATHLGIEVYTSPDRVHWHYTGEALPGGVSWADAYQPGGATDLWAPDISYHHGRYDLYYAVSSFGSNMSAIGLATSTTGLPGSFTDHGLVIASSPTDDWNAIDPGLLVDSHGRWWLTMGSFWTGIKEVRLDPATGKPATGAAVHSLAQRPAAPDALEGAYLVQHGGYYYLFASFGFCCQGLSSTYSIRVGRSTSPTGPFVGANGSPMLRGGGTLLLATHGYVVGPGGQTVLHTGGQDLLVYHYYNGRDAGTPRLGIDRLVWRNGWPTVVR